LVATGNRIRGCGPRAPMPYGWRSLGPLPHHIATQVAPLATPSLSLSLTMAFAWTIHRPIASSVSAGTTKPMRVGRKQQPAGRKQKCVRLEKNGSAPPNLTPWINKEGGSASQLYLVLAPTQSVSRQSRSSGNRAGRCAKIGLQHGTRVTALVVEIGFGGKEGTWRHKQSA
jgi:hypothetical protein